MMLALSLNTVLRHLTAVDTADNHSSLVLLWKEQPLALI